MARGSIRARKGKTGVTYRVVWDAGTDPITGKRIQRSETCRTRKDAERFLADALARVHRGDLVGPSDEFLRDYLPRWFSIRKAQWDTSTIVTNEIVLRIRVLPFLGGRRLSKLRRVDVETWVSELAEQYAVASVGAALNLLGGALNDAVLWEEIPKNVASGVKPAGKDRRPARVWSMADADRFLQSLTDDPWRPVWQLAIDTGLRKSELMALRWEDVDLEYGSIQVTRTVKRKPGGWTEGKPKSDAGRRLLSIGPETVATLKTHRAEQEARRVAAGADWIAEGRVFDRGDGGRITAGNLDGEFARAIARAKVPEISPHGLRHTMTRAMISAGVSVKAAQERLGHASATTTLNVYGHVDERLRMQLGRLVEEEISRGRDQMVTK